MYVCMYTDTLILTRALDSYYYISLIHNMKNQILHITIILQGVLEVHLPPSLLVVLEVPAWGNLMIIDCSMSVNNYILGVQYLLGVLSHSEIKIRHNINFS